MGGVGGELDRHLAPEHLPRSPSCLLGGPGQGGTWRDPDGHCPCAWYRDAGLWGQVGILPGPQRAYAVQHGGWSGVGLGWDGVLAPGLCPGCCSPQLWLSSED